MAGWNLSIDYRKLVLSFKRKSLNENSISAIGQSSESMIQKRAKGQGILE